MKTKHINMNLFRLLILSVLTNILTSCEALAKLQQSQNTSNSTSNNTSSERNKPITYPPNADRIPVTAKLPTSENIEYLTLPFGERYKDNVFSEIELKTEYYANNLLDFEGKNKNLIMDIFTPKNDNDKNRACIIYLYGGGFSMKIDDGMQEITKSMALKGYVVAAIDYRLGFKNAHTAILCAGDIYEGFLVAELRAIQDAIAAINYLKINANRLGINPELIFIGGQSAGAITALNAVYYDNNETETTLIKQIGGSLVHPNANSNYMANRKVAGVFSLAGAITNPKIVNNPNNTPTFLVNGTCDEFIYADSGAVYKCDTKAKNPLLKFPIAYGPNYIYSKLMSKNNPVFFVEVCQSGHSMNNWGYQNVVDWVTSFTFAVIHNKFKSGKTTVYPNTTTCTLSNCN